MKILNQTSITVACECMDAGCSVMDWHPIQGVSNTPPVTPDPDLVHTDLEKQASKDR